ncbi:MAG: histidinol-phosphatase HisJ family protein [candidate division WOR-3 bacterium]
MFDYHIHPDFSSDARGSVVDYCEQARAMGLKEICFTTHYEPDPVRSSIERVRIRGSLVGMDSDWIYYYLEAIEYCRRKFPEVLILAGVEIGYEMGLEGKIADFLAQHRFDYVLGAIHCLDHIAITSGGELDDFRKRLKPRGASEIAGRYFDYVRAAAGSRLFDCLAHLDIWRKYIIPELGADFERAIKPLVVPMVQVVARSGVGLEINTSALRRGESEPYPGSEIIAQAVAGGIKTFTIGSDAHQVEDLGRGLGQAIKLLKRFGLHPTRFRQRQALPG